MKIEYAYYSGIGNTFILINGLSKQLDSRHISQLSSRLCNAKSGIGADGLIIASPSNLADIKMVIFNADGSIPEMCGNGIRCLARFAIDQQLIHKQEFIIETGAGNRSITINNNNTISVDMGPPILQRSLIPMTGPDSPTVINHPITIDHDHYTFTAVSLGNPHAVIFDQPLKSLELNKIGPLIEKLPLFPNRINVEFAQVTTPNDATVRVWERGVGETQACGTGACAVVVAGVLTQKLHRDVTITLPGGPLQIQWSEVTNHVLMTGDATYIKAGTFSV